MKTKQNKKKLIISIKIEFLHESMFIDKPDTIWNRLVEDPAVICVDGNQHI